MINLLEALVSDGFEFGQASDGGGFRFHSRERFNGSVEIALGFVERDTGGTAPVFGGGTAFNVTERGPHRINHDLLCDGGADCHVSGAVTVRGAPVNPVLGVVVGGDNHAGIAGAAPKNPQPGEEPVRSGFPTTTHFGSLNRVEQIRVNDGRMGGRVVELPERQLPQINTGPEQTGNPMIGPFDAVFPQVIADTGNRDPFAPHGEGLPDDGCLVVGCEDTVLAFAVARKLHVPCGDSTGDGTGLRFGMAAFRLPALVFGNEPEEPGLEPLTVGGIRDFSDVEGEHFAPGVLNSFEDVVLNADGPDKAVEVRHDENGGFPGLNGFQRFAQSGPVTDRGTTGHIEFLKDTGQLNALTFTPSGDPVRLVARANKGVTFPASDAADSDDAYGCPAHVLKCLMSLRGVVKHTWGFPPCGGEYGVSA